MPTIPLTPEQKLKHAEGVLSRKEKEYADLLNSGMEPLSSRQKGILAAKRKEIDEWTKRVLIHRKEVITE